MSIVILIKIRYNNTVRHKGVSHSLQTVRENMRDNVRKVTGLCILLFLLAMTAGCGCEEDDGLQEISFGAEGTQQTADGEGIIERAEDTETAEDGSSSTQGTAEQKKAFVYVCGAVNDPGVYEVESDSRVFEAIALAGGVTAEAVPELIDQARVVTDGERIYVPNREEAENGGTEGLGTEVTGISDGNEKGKININTAGKDELMELTGIGEAKAESILRYREEHGGFQSIEELMQIEGIKEGVFNKIKDDITI